MKAKPTQLLFKAKHRFEHYPCIRNNRNDESTIIPNMMNSTKFIFTDTFSSTVLLFASFLTTDIRLNFPFVSFNTPNKIWRKIITEIKALIFSFLMGDTLKGKERENAGQEGSVGIIPFVMTS